MDLWSALMAAILIVAAGASPVDANRLVSAGGAACPQLHWRTLHPAQVHLTNRPIHDVMLGRTVALRPFHFLGPMRGPAAQRSPSASQDIVRCFGKRLVAGELPSWSRVRPPLADSTDWVDLPSDNASPGVFRHAHSASPLCRPEKGGASVGQSKGRKSCCPSGRACALRPAAFAFFDARCSLVGFSYLEVSFQA